MEATIKACETVDEQVGKIVEKALEKDYCVILGADHGNAENMFYENGEVDASHGFNKVRYTIIGNNLENIRLKENKGLKDVAPTILEIMGVEKPIEMKGESLIANE
jgi:2,3-bisphosphoglycerate-independent phosphoglycerate mutase